MVAQRIEARSENQKIFGRNLREIFCCCLFPLCFFFVPHHNCFEELYLSLIWTNNHWIISFVDLLKKKTKKIKTGITICIYFYYSFLWFFEGLELVFWNICSQPHNAVSSQNTVWIALRSFFVLNKYFYFNVITFYNPTVWKNQFV